MHPRPDHQAGPARRVIGLVPAYKPGDQLAGVVAAVMASGRFGAVYCVNDGSGSDYEPVFRQLTEAGVHILRHHVNLGKGMALRTGLNVIACQHPDAAGIVTFDADGQHEPQDIIAVADALIAQPAALVLGCRTLPATAPLRSRFGNTLTRHTLRFFTGMKLRDTQTGLRGVPLALVPDLLRLKTSGYDFELDMLIRAHHRRIVITEVPILAVYIDENAASHFNPIVDSMKIYFIFIRFSSVSISTAFLDYVVFSIAYFTVHNILYAMIAGRAVAATYQFLMSRTFVFKSHQPGGKALVKYGMVLVFLSVLAYTGIHLCNYFWGMSPFVAKILVEGSIFIFSFLLLREFVFDDDEAG